MNSRYQITFLQQCGSLLQAGLGLEESLKMMEKRTRKKGYAEILERIQSNLIEGKNLSTAVVLGGCKFDMTTVALIKAGELSGNLSQNLLRASQSLKERHEQYSKFVTALIYPAIVSVLALGMIIFLITFVYPKIIPLFVNSGTVLPISTRAMILVSNFTASNWLYILLSMVVCGGVTVYLYVGSFAGRLGIEKMILSSPVIGALCIHSQLSDTSFLVGTLSSAGMVIENALDLSIESIGFIHIKQKMEMVIESMKHGRILSECVAEQRIIPPLWSDLISIGEKTENLSQIFLKISQAHKDEIDERMSLINKLIEPVTMIAVGAIVGLIALSIVTPMYSLTSQVHG